MHHQAKNDIGYDEHDIEGKRFQDSIINTGWDEDGEDCYLEDDDSAGQAQLFEDPAGDGVLFPSVMIRSDHQSGGMSIQDIKYDKDEG